MKRLSLFDQQCTRLPISVSVSVRRPVPLGAAASMAAKFGFGGKRDIFIPAPSRSMIAGTAVEGERGNFCYDGVMFRLLKTRQARRSAVAAILPFVEQSRASREIPDFVWFEPYFVGFLGMLITLAASSKARSLDTDDLAAVQSRSWAAITGMRSELIGDEICSLSAARDERFELGCRNAQSFYQAVQTNDGADLFPGSPDEQIQQARVALWARHFESYLSEYLATYMR